MEGTGSDHAALSAYHVVDGTALPLPRSSCVKEPWSCSILMIESVGVEVEVFVSPVDDVLLPVALTPEAVDVSGGDTIPRCR